MNVLKVLLVLVAIWVVLGVIGLIVKGLFWLFVLALIAFGVTLATSASRRDATVRPQQPGQSLRAPLTEPAAGPQRAAASPYPVSSARVRASSSCTSGTTRSSAITPTTTLPP